MVFFQFVLEVTLLLAVFGFVERRLDTQMSRFNLRLELMAVPSALPQDLTLVAEQLRSASEEAFEALTRPEGY